MPINFVSYHFFKLLVIYRRFLTLLEELKSGSQACVAAGKNAEKRTNHKKSVSTHRELNPGPSSSNKHIQPNTTKLETTFDPADSRFFSIFDKLFFTAMKLPQLSPSTLLVTIKIAKCMNFSWVGMLLSHNINTVQSKAN